MMWADSTQLLEATLAAHGRTLGEVAQVLITHGHPDHFGAAGWLAGTADASVVCGRAEVPKLTQATDRPSLVDVIERLGIPNTMHDTFRAFYECVQQMPHPLDPPRLRLLNHRNTLPAARRDCPLTATPPPPPG